MTNVKENLKSTKKNSVSYVQKNLPSDNNLTFQQKFAGQKGVE